MRVLWAASHSLSTASCGDGMSGLPNPRSITSTPARPRLHLQTVDDREDVRGQPGDAAELHGPQRYSSWVRGPGRVTAGGRSRPRAAGVTSRTGHRAVATRNMAGMTEIDVVVEIPRGSRNKYEFDHVNHVFRLDRRLFTATAYPADYGFIPDTLSEDGDPLDAMVLLDEPTFTGCWVTVRPVGVFWMSDDAGPDAKILCVPAGDAALRARHRHQRPTAAPARRDLPLLRGVQDPRTRQALQRPGLGGRRGSPGSRSRPAAGVTWRRHRHSPARRSERQ